MSLDVTIHHLYISPDHNYRGHYGKPPGTNPVIELETAECVAGKGIRGDRYYGKSPGFKGQITFFDAAIYRDMVSRFPDASPEPSAMRRNVLIEGVDLNSLIGRNFKIGGALFEGTEECMPCFWMNTALAEGAEAAMKGHGGLRAKILTDGVLEKGPTALLVTTDPSPEI